MRRGMLAIWPRALTSGGQLPVTALESKLHIADCIAARHAQMSSLAVTPKRLVLNAMARMPDGRKNVWVCEVMSKSEEKDEAPGLQVSCVLLRSVDEEVTADARWNARDTLALALSVLVQLGTPDPPAIPLQPRKHQPVLDHRRPDLSSDRGHLDAVYDRTVSRIYHLHPAVLVSFMRLGLRGVGGSDEHGQVRVLVLVQHTLVALGAAKGGDDVHPDRGVADESLAVGVQRPQGSGGEAHFARRGGYERVTSDRRAGEGRRGGREEKGRGNGREVSRDLLALGEEVHVLRVSSISLARMQLR